MDLPVITLTTIFFLIVCCNCLQLITVIMSLVQIANAIKNGDYSSILNTVSSLNNTTKNNTDTLNKICDKVGCNSSNTYYSKN